MFPQEILTDNGKVFTGRFGAKDTEVLFDRICRENGMDHLLTAPRRPTTAGKIERFTGRFAAEFLTGRVFDDLPTGQDELDRWVVSFSTPSGRARRWTSPSPASRSRPPSQDAWRTPGRCSVNVPVMTGSRAKPATHGIVCGRVAGDQLRQAPSRPPIVHLQGRQCSLRDGDGLLKTVLRTNQKEVRKPRRRAERATMTHEV